MAANTGEKLPALEGRIKPSPHLLFQWSAFTRLSADRQSSFSLGQIPWTAIDRYAERYGIEEPDEYDRFVDLMRAMDREFIAWHSED